MVRQPAGALPDIAGEGQVPVVVRGDVVAQVAHFPFAQGGTEADGPAPEARGQDAGLAVFAQREDVEGDPEQG